MKKYYYMYLASLLLGAILLSSCSTSTYADEQEVEDQKKRELIVGKWVCKLQGNIADYVFYAFKEDGTGIDGYYCPPDANPSPSLPKLRTTWMRYAIVDGQIAFCDIQNDIHPMRPGEVCGQYDDPLIFYDFTVDETTFHLNIAGEHPYTRVSKWSDVGLPDDLLPE